VVLQGFGETVERLDDCAMLADICYERTKSYLGQAGRDPRRR
jgi:hypothetical protein